MTIMVTNKQYKQLLVKSSIWKLGAQMRLEKHCTEVCGNNIIHGGTCVSEVEEKIVYLTQPECKMCLPADLFNNLHLDKNRNRNITYIIIQILMITLS